MAPEQQASTRPMSRVRALMFGSVAERYERYRLDYPTELVDTVLAYAGRPVGTALEVGAGTGKATRPIATRGIEVIAQKQGADPAAVAFDALGAGLLLGAALAFLLPKAAPPLPPAASGLTESSR